MLNNILWPEHIQWLPLLIRLCTEFWVVSIEHLRRVWHADRGRLLLWTPGPVPLGLAYVLLVQTNPFPNLSLFFQTVLFEYPSVLSRFCFMISRLGWLLVFDLYMDVYCLNLQSIRPCTTTSPSIQSMSHITPPIANVKCVVPFDCTTVAGSGKGPLNLS